MKMHLVEVAYDRDNPGWRQQLRLAKPWYRYPRLLITGFSSPASRAADSIHSDEAVWVLSRAEIWKHLTRRGSALDQFDHPTLFARTGFPGSPINDFGRALLMEYLVGPWPRYFNVVNAEADNAAAQQGNPAAREEETIEALGLAPQYTVCGINIAVTTLICRATNLVNLSLTGTLDLCLSFNIETFQTLRSLSLGPLLPIWQDSALFKLSAPYQMRDLENLRVCGGFINTIEASQIAGENGCFPSLKRFQWEAVQTCKPYERSVWIVMLQPSFVSSG